MSVVHIKQPLRAGNAIAHVKLRKILAWSEFRVNEPIAGANNLVNLNISGCDFARALLQDMRHMKLRTDGITSLLFLALGSLTISPAVGLEKNPERNAYFGDEHIHTSWSLDAWIFGDRITGTAVYG